MAVEAPKFFFNTETVAVELAENFIGLKTQRPFYAGETVYTIIPNQTGRVVTTSQSFSGPCIERSIILAPDLHCCTESSHPMYFTNHSCVPTIQQARFGLRQQGSLWAVSYQTLRSLDIGDSITIDYASITTANDGDGIDKPYHLDCLCGSPHCRHTITGFAQCDPVDQYKLFDSQAVSATVVAEAIESGLVDPSNLQQSPSWGEYLQALSEQQHFAQMIKNSLRF